MYMNKTQTNTRTNGQRRNANFTRTAYTPARHTCNVEFEDLRKKDTKIRTLEAEKKRLEKENKTMQEGVKNLKDENDAIHKELENLKNENDAIHKELKTLQNEVKQQRDDLSKKEQETLAKSNKIGTIAKEMHELFILYSKNLDNIGNIYIKTEELNRI